ncbi:MAG: helix-turn-helix domain-containing protein [Alphaproteobacteria bacterium]|nr:helix-turn-helix domain-containing protein [Alphaproteobacteria bacterium]
MDYRQVVAHNVRAFRQERVWSQEELAHRAGVHRTYISQVERAVTNPTVTVIAKIAHALGVEPAALLELPKGH